VLIRRIVPLAISGSVMAASGLMMAAPGPASAATPLTFGITRDLGNAGGEPSIMDDGRGHLYITTPQGTGSTNSNGVLLQRSLDGGITWQPNQLIGGTVGGSDSDVLTDVTGQNAFVADLFAAGTNVLRSTDTGASWPNNTVTGPEDDREWLTTIGPTIFVTYHDFALGIPLIFISTDNGASFTPGGNGGQIISPTDLGFANSKCNTLVSKPVADVQGNLYVLTNASTPAEYAQTACALVSPLDTLYMSVSHDGGHTFTTSLVADVSAAATGKATSGYFAHSFNQLGIDNAGNLYIDTTSTLDGSNGGIPLQNYLIVSKDHGTTWSKPIATNPGPNGQVFPSIAVGQAGQVSVGYYQGVKPDHRANGSNFQFVVDQTFNATDPNPTFTHTTLVPLKGTTPHPDGICTDGIFCGTPASSGGNRNLADFESMTVDPSGNLEVIIPADCLGGTTATTCTGTENWFYKQTAGLQMPPGPTNGNGTGNQTWVAGARTTAPPQPPPAPPPSPTTSAANPIERQLPVIGAAFLVAALLIAVAWFAPRRRRTD
jgi:hypothetical protein